MRNFGHIEWVRLQPISAHAGAGAIRFRRANVVMCSRRESARARRGADTMLLCCTEMNKRKDMDALAEVF